MADKTKGKTGVPNTPDGYHHVTIGSPGEEDVKPIRIVHISDTHGAHEVLLKHIPDGDIFIHSGDFSSYGLSKYFLGVWDYKRTIAEVNKYFAKLPHKHKIFVAGNHEINFTSRPQETVQKALPNGIYLQDSSVTLEGIKIYGSPWNIKRKSSYARGFSIEADKLDEVWRKIPGDTDILVTHSPPFGVRDCLRMYGDDWICPRTTKAKICHHGHMGCASLLKHVTDRVRPKAHLFGHYHGANGVQCHSDVWFCNGALPKEIDERHMPVVLDYFADDADAEEQNVCSAPSQQYSAIMEENGEDTGTGDQ